jgi:AP endonuclease 2
MQGSDHCPVYVVIKDKVEIDGHEVHIKDIVNPPGMFEDGQRKQLWTSKNLLPTSGRLLPEFDKRRNIEDMFSGHPSSSSSSQRHIDDPDRIAKVAYGLPTESFIRDFAYGGLAPMRRGMLEGREALLQSDASLQSTASPMQSMGMKRWQNDGARIPAAKRTKSATESTGANVSARGQQSLARFFTTNTPTNVESNDREGRHVAFASGTTDVQGVVNNTEMSALSERMKIPLISRSESKVMSTVDEAGEASRQSWRKLFTKPLVPNCEHGEPCKTMVTTKAGMNHGRSFWMCNRPIGPSGNNEKNTAWRCNTFIWASDWNGMDNV